MYIRGTVLLLRNTLVLHENKQAEIKNDTLYIDGKPVQHCYFTKDYYWVGANNSINLSDSRLFGFVPKDHIIGKASLIWFSKKRQKQDCSMVIVEKNVENGKINEVRITNYEV